LIRAAFASVSQLAVIPLQDLFDLGAAARMNSPGTVEGNWQWRYTRDMLARLAEERGETLRHWRQLFDRTGDSKQRDYSAPPEAPLSAVLADSAASEPLSLPR
jgi:4-alpha-glucanotransferase